MAKRKTKLQKCFDEYNKKYFNGRLHDVEVSWAKQPRVDGGRVDAYCHCNEDLYRANKIVLGKFLMRKSWMWQIVLLHEMNHLDFYQTDGDPYAKHEPQFDIGMLRLAKIGALNGLW